jgi:hypothetical protein
MVFIVSEIEYALKI